MASIEKRGSTYRITVSIDFKEDGVPHIRKVTSILKNTKKPTTQKERSAE
jgi:hypothetical protein